MAPKRIYHYPLDAARFLSALGIALFHLGFYSWASGSATTSRMFAHAGELKAFVPIAPFFGIGLYLFFVISGFFIAYSANGTSPLAFLKARILRLYPSVWICATITLFAWILIDGRPLHDLVGPYIKSMIIWPLPEWIDGVYWALMVEISFYLTIFMLLLFGQLKRLAAYAWALTLASGLYLSAIWLGIAPMAGWLWNHSHLLLLHHGSLFAIGIWMWKTSNCSMRVIDWAGLALALGVALMSMSLRLMMFQTDETSTHTNWFASPLIGWIACTALLFMFTRWPTRFRPRHAVTRLTIRKLGETTYPLYLVHNVVGAGCMRLLIDAGMNAYLALVLVLIAMVSLAGGIAWYADPLIKSWLRPLLNLVSARVMRLPGLYRLRRPSGVLNYTYR